jgi:23S rRNA (adenine2503-C2)-methyltransferase
MMAMFHHCSVPLARAVLPSSRTRAVAAMSLATSSSSRTIPQSQVLLGLSEDELQKLALDFGQVNFLSFFISLHYCIIQFNWVFIKCLNFL